MIALYKGIQENKLKEWKFHAGVHGIDIDGKNTTSSTSTSSTPVQSDPNVPLFGDPESYQSLSDEEREAQTQKMLSKHKSWYNKSFMKG